MTDVRPETAIGRFLRAAIGLFMVLFASPVLFSEVGSEFPSGETIEVPSLTLTNEQFLRGDTTNGVPVALAGELRFPNGSVDLPVVVLLHGSDGALSTPVFHWGQFLNTLGVATLRLDSFGRRGIGEVGADQSQLSVFAQIYDAYRAVDALAVHPRIDPSRIAVMGFSRGGVAALYTSMRPFQDLYGPRGTHIAAHLPFYPSCNFQLAGEPEIADAPIREFHGAADDWTLAAPCRDYIARLQAAGKDASMAEYPEAFHAFDAPGSPPALLLQDAQNMGKCQRREEDGKINNRDRQTLHLP